jgi:predicted DNA-binding protein (UPF0251 family)
MNREDIKKVLNCPSKPLLMLALELVNLKDKERLAIELVDIRGMTQEKASIKIDCSIKSITNYRNKAYKKLGKAWENQELIKKILEG